MLRWYWFLLCPLGLWAQEESLIRCRSGNCFEGFGTADWPNGNRYVGNWQGGKMQGQGLFYWADGRKYLGQWAEAKMQGFGTLFFPDGSVYSGQWYQNQFVAQHRPQYPLASSGLRHAEGQLRQLLADRPQLCQGPVQEGDPIWQWILRKLAGEDTGSLIHWAKGPQRGFEPPKGVQAAHRYPTATHEGLIWLNPQGSAEQLWASLIYELFNISNHAAFAQIEEDVQRGRCNKEQYIYRYAQLEHGAALRTANFYQSQWRRQYPQWPSQAQYWYAYVPVDFQVWLEGFRDRKGYPWYPYEGFYEELLRRSVERY